MKTTLFSSFGEKEVINCRDGKILGCPSDLRFDAENGRIVSFFIKEPGKLGFLSKGNVIEIFWDRITKIGDDIILVDIDRYPAHPDEKPKKEKKYFFGS